MIFIAGVQPRTVRIEKHAQACPSCAHFDVYLKRVDQYISLFFIPLIRIKSGIPFLVCENCGTYQHQRGTAFEYGQAGKTQKCASCGKPIEPAFSYCPYCGRPL
jgi:hypothetical protein